MTLLRAILHPITFQQLSKSTFTGCQTIEGIQNVYLAINRWKGTTHRFILSLATPAIPESWFSLVLTRSVR